MKQFSPQFFRGIPVEPGVYFMLGSQGEILYIGKAKNLRKRISSYRRVRFGTHPPHQVEMVGLIQEIRWELCASENAALARENELLHAVRPPYNIADTEEASYLFVTLRKLRADGYYEFRITSDPELESCSKKNHRAIVFGCYKNRLQTRRGFAALLRLIYSVSFQGKRFSIPSILRRSRIEFGYTIRFEDEWVPEFSQFMRGESLLFLRRMTERLIQNESVPRFMGPSLQDDINSAREFFRAGAKNTRELKRQWGLRTRILSHDQMDELIRLSVPKVIGSLIG